MTDLSDFKRIVYEPQVQALRERVATAERERDQAREALQLFLDFFDEETMHTHSPSAMCAIARAAMTTHKGSCRVYYAEGVCTCGAALTGEGTE